MRPASRGTRLATIAAGAVLLAAVAGAQPADSQASGHQAFHLVKAGASPDRAFFDAARKAKLRYAFRTRESLDLAIRVVRTKTGNAVRRWVEKGGQPGRTYTRAWSGRRADGSVAPSGRYRFELAPLGARPRKADSFRFADHRFPVAKAHAYGDRFGVPRSGGRTHEGQDVVADCGTPLVAARGGHIQDRGYSDSLYGHWVLIDGRATRRDHFYAHLFGPTALRVGQRIRTGDRIGTVGKSGNARYEFCQLHFELWPSGYRHGAPIDPLAALRRWDRYGNS